MLQHICEISDVKGVAIVHEPGGLTPQRPASPSPASTSFPPRQANHLNGRDTCGVVGRALIVPEMGTQRGADSCRVGACGNCS